MLNKRKAIEEQSQSRKMKLDDSALYFQFDREVEETMAWLDEKTKTASDESYKVIVSPFKNSIFLSIIMFILQDNTEKITNLLFTFFIFIYCTSFYQKNNY